MHNSIVARQKPIIRICKILIKDQRIRFLIVGGINTLVGYGTFAALIFCGAHYIFAQVVATIIGTTCSYILNKYFTFKQYRKSFAEVCRFIFVYMVSFFKGIVLLYLLISIMSLNAYFAGMLNIVFTMLISWFGHKYFSFRGN